MAILAPDAGAQMQSEIQQRREWRADDLVFSNNFSGARLNALRRLAEDRYLAISRPEFNPPLAKFGRRDDLDTTR